MGLDEPTIDDIARNAGNIDLASILGYIKARLDLLACCLFVFIVFFWPLIRSVCVQFDASGRTIPWFVYPFVHCY